VAASTKKNERFEAGTRILRRGVWQQLTDVSGDITACIIMAVSSLLGWWHRLRSAYLTLPRGVLSSRTTFQGPGLLWSDCHFIRTLNITLCGRLEFRSTERIYTVNEFAHN
jgi:hypothetical protein